MANIKPKTWTQVIPATTPTPLDNVVTTALVIQNMTGTDLFIGGEDSQDWIIPVNAEFEVANIDNNQNDGNSEMFTKDVYVRSVAGGSINVLVMVRA